MNASLNKVILLGFIRSSAFLYSPIDSLDSDTYIVPTEACKESFADGKLVDYVTIGVNFMQKLKSLCGSVSHSNALSRKAELQVKFASQ